jgi:2-oxoglutarate dehydrogenase complex dehydrogenase (E1) component-like enzyme
VQDLVTAFRTHGHLMADVDPLEYRQRSRPDLELASHGREVAGGAASDSTAMWSST